MEIDVQEIDFRNLSRDEWNLFHDYRKKRHFERIPDDPVNPDSMVEIARVQEANDDNAFSKSFFIFLSDDHTKLIGFLGLGFFTEKNPSYKGNEHICEFNLSFLPEYRRQGFGSQVLKKIIDFADLHHKSLLLTNTSEDSGKSFLKKLGFSFALAGRENRLILDNVDWNMIHHWVDDGVKRNPKTKITFFDRIPDDIIDPYSKIYTETLNQQPFGSLDIADMIMNPELLRKREKEFNELGIIPTTAITIEANGDISGLTEMFYQQKTKKILIQALTGVRDNHRGRGLGKWLKAAMLLSMKDRYPEATIVKTGNADSNAPMLSINNRLGFNVFKEDVMTQCKVEDLKNIILVHSGV